MAATSLRALPALESPFDAEDLAMSRSTGPKKLKPLVKAEPGHFDPPPGGPAQSLLRSTPLFVGVDGDDRLIGDMGVKERTCAPDLDDMVNAMLPPRQWTQLTGTWCQFVSRRPRRDDLVALSNELDGLLRDRQARPKGICPVRQALFSQTFDELIRQVTLDQPLLGLMLLRIRDQQRMVNDATSWVHLAGVDFGMEKLIAAEPAWRLIVKIAALEAESSTIVDHIMGSQEGRRRGEARGGAAGHPGEDQPRRDRAFQGQRTDGPPHVRPGGNKPT
ncbi:dynein heavy chain binding protein [Aureococcus anophagefferens]|nr:dynein heavy chain binding protein [Aureococcus anophagefferens]